MNMRVLILAIDALEYDLVEELNLRHIKQVEYGKVIEPTTKLLTPILWGAFITGTVKHGVEAFTVKNPLVKASKNFLEILGIDPYGTPIWLFYRALTKVGMSSRRVDKRDLQAKTIFGHAENPVAISIPAYNEWESIHKLRLKYPLARFVGKRHEKKASECIEANWKIFRRKLNYTSEMLGKDDWDLLMVHFLILDNIGHLYSYKPGKLKNAYRFMNSAVGELLSKVKDQWVLIVSDHGMKKGLHTNYAFYSSNIPLGLDNPELTDFHDLILEKMKS